MHKTQPMILILTASIAAISTVLYNLFQKLTPAEANPALALTVTYGTALAATLLLFAVYPLKSGLGISFQKLNWASFALGLAITGVEIGTLLAYRAGWQISLLGIMVNVVASLLLVLIGVFFFKEKLSLVNLLGILICIAGLAMLNFKR
jgi:drug/metabolite transporter (DMT)-like permease